MPDLGGIDAGTLGLQQALGAGAARSNVADAVSALVHLGYSSQQASAALARIVAREGDDVPTEKLIRLGLRELSSMSAFDIAAMSDPVWIGAFLEAHWHDDFLVSRGKRTEVCELDGAVARQGRRDRRAHYDWRRDADEMEITSFDSLEPGIGIGTGLLEHVFRRTPAPWACGAYG